VTACLFMGVADGDGERVGGIVAFELGLGHQDFQHHVYLLLFAVADADHGLLDGVRRIFRDPQARPGRHQHGDAARLAELQRGGRILVDEGLLDSGLVRLVAVHHLGKPVMQLAEAGGKIHLAIGSDGAGSDETQRIAERFDDPPAGAPQARIDADDANRILHASPYFGRRDAASKK
jgi:hypothetical protein